jgi:hypothetical protein
MKFLDIANRQSREQAEADPNVALMIVHPEEQLDVMNMLAARESVEVVHREPGLNDDTLLYVAVRMNGRRRGWSGPGCRSGGSDACSRLAVAARDDSGFYDPAKTRSTHAGTASLAGP